MGSDVEVCNAARVCFAKESIPEPDGSPNKADKKLIRYLATHAHWTPFAHCFLKFRVKTSFAMARQLVKHQVGLVWNEVSRRYVSTEPEFYIPDVWRKAAENKKQGSTDEEVVYLELQGFTEPTVRNKVLHFYEYSLDLYEEMIRCGICPEQARFVLPLGAVTEWIWSGSLAAFARVCRLRLDPHAQKEVRDVAVQIDASVPAQFKHSWAALME